MKLLTGGAEADSSLEALFFTALSLLHWTPVPKDK